MNYLTDLFQRNWFWTTEILMAKIEPTISGDEMTKLRIFYQEIAELTINHDVVDDNAVVYPSKLGKALSKIDPEWWRKA